MAKEKSASAQKLDELTAQHGPCAHYTTPEGKLFAFRALSLDEYEDFQDRLAKGKRGPILREMCQVTCIHPDALADLQAQFVRAPAFSGLVSDELFDLAGGNLKVQVKKG